MSHGKLGGGDRPPPPPPGYAYADHKFSNKIISSVGRIQEIACEARIKCTVLDLSKNQCRVGIIPIRFWLIAFRFSSIAPGGCFIGHDKDSH